MARLEAVRGAYGERPLGVVFGALREKDIAGMLSGFVGEDHLVVLAKISSLLKDKFFRQALKDAKSVEDVLKVIREGDEF